MAETETTSIDTSSAKGAAVDGVAYSSLMAIINAVTTTSQEVFIQELGKIMSDKNSVEFLNKHGMPYLYAAGLLSFAGRDINIENMSKVMNAIGAKPDFLDMFLVSKIKSHLIYVYAFYYLLANGRETFEEGVAKVVEALGVKVDAATLKESLDYINAHM